MRVGGMMETRETARALMLEAKELLAGAETLSAFTYLDYAIICVDLAAEEDGEGSGAPPPMLVGRNEPGLVHAIGSVLAILATILERHEMTSPGELAQLFGIYAGLIGEQNPASGRIVAGWEAMLCQVANQRRDPDEK